MEVKYIFVLCKDKKDGLLSFIDMEGDKIYISSPAQIKHITLTSEDTVVRTQAFLREPNIELDNEIRVMNEGTAFNNNTHEVYLNGELVECVVWDVNGSSECNISEFAPDAGKMVVSISDKTATVRTFIVGYLTYCLREQDGKIIDTVRLTDTTEITKQMMEMSV